MVFEVEANTSINTSGGVRFDYLVVILESCYEARSQHFLQDGSTGLQFFKLFPVWVLRAGFAF